MKPRLRAQGGVANPRDSTGYRCGLHLALNANPSVSLCATMNVTRHWQRLLARLIGQIEPVLHEVHAQHALARVLSGNGHCRSWDSAAR